MRSRIGVFARRAVPALAAPALCCRFLPSAEAAAIRKSRARLHAPLTIVYDRSVPTAAGLRAAWDKAHPGGPVSPLAKCQGTRPIFRRHARRPLCGGAGLAERQGRGRARRELSARTGPRQAGVQRSVIKRRRPFVSPEVGGAAHRDDNSIKLAISCFDASKTDHETDKRCGGCRDARRDGSEGEP